MSELNSVSVRRNATVGTILGWEIMKQHCVVNNIFITVLIWLLTDMLRHLTWKTSMWTSFGVPMVTWNRLLCASPWTLNLYAGRDWFLVFVSLPVVLCSILICGFFCNCVRNVQVTMDTDALRYWRVTSVNKMWTRNITKITQKATCDIALNTFTVYYCTPLYIHSVSFIFIVIFIVANI